MFKKIILTLLVSFILGIGSIFLVAGFGFKLLNLNGSSKFGSWMYEPLVGSKESGFYTKAFVAIAGFLAQSKAETVYFLATEDANGKNLDLTKTYKIEGKNLDARWWSITAYSKNYLIPNKPAIYSFTKTTIKNNLDGTYTILASAKKQNENWLPLGDKNGNFDLLLRCYIPSDAFNNSLKNGTVQLPTIKQIR